MRKTLIFVSSCSMLLAMNLSYAKVSSDLSGFYVGVQAAGAYQNNDFYSPDISTYMQFDSHPDLYFSPGLSAGYNFQYGNAILGVKAEFNFPIQEGRYESITTYNSNTYKFEQTIRTKDYGSLLAVLGAKINENSFFYGNFGIGYISTKMYNVVHSGSDVTIAHPDKTIPAFVTGVGFRCMMTKNLYVNFDINYYLGQNAKHEANTLLGGQTLSYSPLQHTSILKSALEFGYKF